MALSERLKAPKGKEYRCAFADWKAGLPAVERETVDRVLNDPSYTIDELVAAFTEEGCPVRHHRIRVHRAHTCLTCDR